MSKSRPLYRPLERDATGQRHLLVFQTTAAVSMAEAFRSENDAHVAIWIVDAQPPVGDDDKPGTPAGVGFVACGFISQEALFEALDARLRTETMGLRLYGVGDEAFLWDLFGLASAAGLGREEVRLTQVGPPVRRVYCTHCTTMNEGVRTDLVVCRGCGLTLAVRDHFSRRLSAFMGVYADAEVPGELRAPQALGA